MPPTHSTGSGLKGQIRVRIAPSPTGYLHVGTARTALFNWLFAKKHGGVFILRIEDTDRDRSSEQYEKDILENLKWLGLDWDEFYRQSERGEIYKKYIKKLLDEKHAYYCFCTKGELEAERQGMLSQGLPPKYSGKCRALSEENVKSRMEKGEDCVIRFKMPDTEISFTDVIRGKVTFDMALVGDIVIAKNPSAPLYNFAAVVDDFEMRISHVIRAEDHLPNTPKQIVFGKALGFPIPNYAHLPLILNPDRSKMSKRYEATAISEYRAAGYLARALVNFFALLGWHPAPEIDPGTGKTHEREIFSPEELIAKFDLERVQKAGAVFNVEKLDWLNSQYLKQIPTRKLMSKIKEFAKLPTDWNEKKLIAALEAVRDRMKKLTDFTALTDFFFNLPDYQAGLLIWKTTPVNQISDNLKAVSNILKKAAAKSFSKEVLIGLLEPLVKEYGRGEVFWPIRVALSGREASPGPFEIMEVLGKAETLKRIKVAIEKLEKVTSNQ